MRTLCYSGLIDKKKGCIGEMVHRLSELRSFTVLQASSTYGDQKLHTVHTIDEQQGLAYLCEAVSESSCYCWGNERVRLDYPRNLLCDLATY